MSGSHNTHARKAPSDSHRWTTCTSALAYERMFALATAGSLDRDEKDELNVLLGRFGVSFAEAAHSGYIADTGSSYANEGTEAHDWAEKVLLNQVKLMELPEKFRDPVGIYVQECRRLAQESEGFEPFIEAQVPLFYNTADTGTMDFGIASSKKVAVRDYKHGAGQFVDVEENSQLAIYAYSFMLWLEDEGYYTFDPDTEVEIGIVQPRHHQGPPVRIWTLSYHDLKLFCDNIQRIHDIVDSGEGCEFAPGSACKWCGVKAFCAARLKSLTEGLPTLEGGNEADFLADMPYFDDRGSESAFQRKYADPEERISKYAEDYGIIPVARMVAIYKARKGIAAFIKDVEKHLTNLALSGTPAPGTKLVMGREGNTAWIDEAGADELLQYAGIPEESRHVTKLVSVTQAKELLGDRINDKKKKNPLFDPQIFENWSNVIGRSPGKKTLALENDKRPAVESSIDDMPEFDDEDMPED